MNAVLRILAVGVLALITLGMMSVATSAQVTTRGELTSLGLNTQDAYGEALRVAVADLESILAALKVSKGLIEKELLGERAGQLGSIREQSEVLLRKNLNQLPTRAGRRITDKFLQMSRAKDGVVATSLGELYWEVVQESIGLADRATSADRTQFELINGRVLATQTAIEQIENLIEGLNKFRDVISKRWAWRANPATLAELFGSEDFKTRIQKISEEVGKVQAAIAQSRGQGTSGQE